MLSQTIFYSKEIFLMNLMPDSEAILLMIPLNCLWGKSNNRTRGQFECNVTWFCFVLFFIFYFFFLHARCGCYSIFCWGGPRRGVLKIVLPSSKGVEKFCTYMDRGVGIFKIRKFSWASYVYRP